MNSSRTITLFSDRPDPFVSGSSFAVSILMHGAIIGVVALAILYGPQNHRIVTERYAVRHLELHAPEPQAHSAPAQEPPVHSPNVHDPQAQDPLAGRRRWMAVLARASGAEA